MSARPAGVAAASTAPAPVVVYDGPASRVGGKLTIALQVGSAAAGGRDVDAELFKCSREHTVGGTSLAV